MNDFNDPSQIILPFAEFKITHELMIRNLSTQHRKKDRKKGDQTFKLALREHLNTYNAFIIE